jgi:hypothetical protein
MGGREPQDDAVRLERESRDVPEHVQLPEGVLTKAKHRQTEPVAALDLELVDLQKALGFTAESRQVEDAPIVMGAGGKLEEPREFAKDVLTLDLLEPGSVVDEAADYRVALVVGVVLGDGVDQA